MILLEDFRQSQKKLERDLRVAYNINRFDKIEKRIKKLENREYIDKK